MASETAAISEPALAVLTKASKGCAPEMRYFWAMMVAGTGRIVTVSSMAVGLHEEGTAAYAAAKSAIVEMTKILAKELAPNGITAKVVAPSMFPSDAFEALGDAVQARARSKLTIPRMVTIEEIASVIAFFAGPDSAPITGQVIHMGLVV